MYNLGTLEGGRSMSAENKAIARELARHFVLPFLKMIVGD
jgi:hypothetical protein